MSKALKKYKKELKSFFNNASKEKSQYTTIYIYRSIDEYPGVDEKSYDELVE